MEKENTKSKPGSVQGNKPGNIGRREVLKTLATVPLLGAMAFGVARTRKTKLINRDISDVFKLSNANAVYLQPQAGGRQIRIGLIGYGIRGTQLMRAIGFVQPSYIDTLIEAGKKNPDDTRYDEYKEQDDLNVVITGVCDIFDVYSEAAMLAGSNINKEGTGGKFGLAPRQYKTYQELLAADDIDAVIIAAPDHWHGTIAMAAARAGKHVYCEKPVTWTVPETYSAPGYNQRYRSGIPAWAPGSPDRIIPEG